MTVFQAFLLGVLQGATEFLPVSSSGHLVLIPWLFRWQPPEAGNLAFDTLVHGGTLLAVLSYYWRDIVQIVTAVWTGLRQRDPWGTAEARLGWLLLLGSTPAGLAGLLLEAWFEEMFSRPPAAALALLVTAGLLAFAEAAGRGERRLQGVGWADALWIGLAQALAIFPGISRSGATISTGVRRGIDRTESARFSFLLGIPAIAGACGKQLLDLIQSGSLQAQAGILLAGVLSAAVVGYLSIHVLLMFLRRRPLTLFSAYCALLGATSLIVYVVRA